MPEGCGLAPSFSSESLLSLSCLCDQTQSAGEFLMSAQSAEPLMAVQSFFSNPTVCSVVQNTAGCSSNTCFSLTLRFLLLGNPVGLFPCKADFSWCLRDSVSDLSFRVSIAEYSYFDELELFSFICSLVLFLGWLFLFNLKQQCNH